MEIDGRNMTQREILFAVREVLADDLCTVSDTEGGGGSQEDASKVRAYASMTGCDIKVSKSDEYFVVKIKAGSCRCG